MEQNHTCCPRSRGHFTQPSQHLVAVLGWIDSPAFTCLLFRSRWVEGEDANRGRLEGVRHRNGPLEAVEMLVERAIDGNLSNRRAYCGDADPVRIQHLLDSDYLRSEERRVGKECS